MDQEKYAQAAKDMPPLHKLDKKTVNSREIFLKARGYGYKKPGSKVIDSLLSRGYDATLIDQARKTGTGNFLQLANDGHVDLTAEYTALTHFPELLTPKEYTAIKNLLANFKVVG